MTYTSLQKRCLKEHLFFSAKWIYQKTMKTVQLSFELFLLKVLFFTTFLLIGVYTRATYYFTLYFLCISHIIALSLLHFVSRVTDENHSIIITNKFWVIICTRCNSLASLGSLSLSPDFQKPIRWFALHQDFQLIESIIDLSCIIKSKTHIYCNFCCFDMY